MEEKYLIEIIYPEYPKEKIYEWKYVEIKKVRIYYKIRDNKKTGFDFYIVANCGYEECIETKKDVWSPNYCYVECIYWGTAYFDGIRHLYMGDKFTDNERYFYYPNLDDNIDVIKELRKLELKYCWDCNK